MVEDSCVFCAIVEGKVPSTKQYEDEDIIAFNSIAPETPIHVLIVPKKHIARLSEAQDSDSELLGKLQLVIKQVATKLGIAEAFKVQVNNGSAAGQVIFHLHYHLLGGFDATVAQRHKKGGK